MVFYNASPIHKRKERSERNGGALISLSYCLKSRRFGTESSRQQQKVYDISSIVSESKK